MKRVDELDTYRHIDVVNNHAKIKKSLLGKPEGMYIGLVNENNVVIKLLTAQNAASEPRSNLNWKVAHKKISALRAKYMNENGLRVCVGLLSQMEFLF